MTEVTEGLRHKMEIQDDHIVGEVDKLREHYRQVHSSIGLCSPSWTYIHLGSSPQVVATGMEGSYSPSLSCKL